MLRDLQPNWREILDLPPLARHHISRVDPVGKGRLAGRAEGGAMFDHGVGLGHQMQRLAGVPELPARLLARLAPQAAGSGQLALEPI